MLRTAGRLLPRTTKTIAPAVGQLLSSFSAPADAGVSLPRYGLVNPWQGAASSRRFTGGDAWDSLKDSYNDIKVDLEGPVATITLHRPEALNALNSNVSVAAAMQTLNALGVHIISPR